MPFELLHLLSLKMSFDCCHVYLIAAFMVVIDSNAYYITRKISLSSFYIYIIVTEEDSAIACAYFEP